MREFDALCLTPVTPMAPEEIKALREREQVSHPVFASYLNVRKDAVSKWERGEKASRRDGPKAQSRVREMLEIINLVQGWAGGAAQAMAWYRAEPIPAFGGRTAEALVKSGAATAVRDYVDHLATGGYA